MLSPIPLSPVSRSQCAATRGVNTPDSMSHLTATRLWVAVVGMIPVMSLSIHIVEVWG